MSVTAAPSATFTAEAEGFTTGLAGTVGMTVIDNTGATVVARQTSGITEHATVTGRYRGETFTAPAYVGDDFLLDWDDGSGNHAYETLVVDIAESSDDRVFRAVTRALGVDVSRFAD